MARVVVGAEGHLRGGRREAAHAGGADPVGGSWCTSLALRPPGGQGP